MSRSKSSIANQMLSGVPIIRLNLPIEETVCETIVWHLVKTRDNIPHKGLWFLCQIRGSDDLKLVCGYENVIFEKYSAWANVKAVF